MSTSRATCGVSVSVPEDYIAVAVMALVGIGFPVGSFIGSRLLRPLQILMINHNLALGYCLVMRPIKAYIFVGTVHMNVALNL